MKVYFIGAGPGDPELLTLKAKKIIEKADVLVYAGSLVSKAILRFARKGVKIHDSSRMTLEEVVEIFQRAKANAKIVARIHSGEPSIYGAIQEQIDWCQENNIDCQVIPGISSFQQAAASLKQELTLPGISQTVILTRISGRTNVPLKEDLQRLAKLRATMIIFLSIQEIARVMEKIKKGYGLDTPVAVIEKVSRPDERIIFGKVSDIAKKVKRLRITRQALIIIGDVLRKEYQRSKLYDKYFTHGFRSAGKR